MKPKKTSRRRFGASAAAAALTSGCIPRSGSYDPEVEEPPVIGGWLRPDRWIHPMQDARAAVARRHGNRVDVVPDPVVPPRLCEVLSPHLRAGIRAVHPFGKRVGVVTWGDAEVPEMAPFPVYLLSKDLRGAKKVAEASGRPLVTSGRLVFIPQMNDRVDMHRALDGARVAEVRGGWNSGSSNNYPVVSMVAQPPFAVMALESEDRAHASEFHDLRIQLTRLYRVRGRQGSRVARNRPLRTWYGWSRGTLLASRGPTVVCAENGGFTWFDWGLEPRHAQPYSGAGGQVRGLRLRDVTLGPANAAHALLENSWLVSCASPGAKPVAVKVDMPPYLRGVPGSAWKLLAGPAGLVALAPPGKILCFNAHGQLQWEFKRNGSAPALVVEGGILVEHDAALFKLSWEGKFEHVWTAPEPLTARPLHHDGYWYVATTKGLHKLAPA